MTTLTRRKRERERNDNLISIARHCYVYQYCLPLQASENSFGCRMKTTASYTLAKIKRLLRLLEQHNNETVRLCRLPSPPPSATPPPPSPTCPGHNLSVSITPLSNLQIFLLQRSQLTPQLFQLSPQLQILTQLPEKQERHTVC